MPNLGDRELTRYPQRAVPLTFTKRPLNSLGWENSCTKLSGPMASSHCRAESDCSFSQQRNQASVSDERSTELSSTCDQARRSNTRWRLLSIDDCFFVTGASRPAAASAVFCFDHSDLEASITSRLAWDSSSVNRSFSLAYLLERPLDYEYEKPPPSKLTFSFIHIKITYDLASSLIRIKESWGGRIRTPECRDQNPVSYHLTTPQISLIQLFLWSACTLTGNNIKK